MPLKKTAAHLVRFVRGGYYSDMLWTAPELFDKQPLLQPTTEADIYSFGILCSELITEMEAFGANKSEHNMTDDGLLSFLCKRWNFNFPAHSFLVNFS